jgi:two-component system cell cycle response regulator DivK
MPSRVLVVEDNSANLELVVALLEQEGCEVLVAETAEAGLRLARETTPHLILMDVHLPGMSGFEASRKLKADPATARILILAITAQAMKGDETKARQAGCDGYLAKPLDLDTKVFCETIRRFLPQGTDEPGHRKQDH